MKIDKVETFIVPSGRVGANLLVRITSDSGISGLGQSGAWGFPDAAEKIVQQFGNYLIGRDAFRIEHHWQSLFRLRPFRGNVVNGALSALDIALWDMKAKALQVPVWELLGGKSRDRVRLHLIVKGSSQETLYAAVAAAATDGFTAIKIDPLPSGWQDMTLPKLISTARSLCAAAREAAGDDIDLIVELHRKLSPVNAVDVSRSLAQFHPLFIEDPIQIDSIVSQSDLARRIDSPIANGERLSTIWEFRELLVNGGPQYLRPDVGLAGGLSHCKKIAAVAESFHCSLALHNFLGPVLTAASVHLDVSIPNVATLEYVYPADGDESVRTTLVRDGGYIVAPETPGLGVEIDEAVLRVPDSNFGSLDVLLRADGSVAKAL